MQIAFRVNVFNALITVATAGGLVFTGTSDKKLIALDARTGQQLWSSTVDAGVNAPPISYEVHGVQYIAVAATGLQTLNTPRGDEMVAFALPHEGPAGAGLPNVLGPNPDSAQIDIGPNTPPPGAPTPKGAKPGADTAKGDTAKRKKP